MAYTTFSPGSFGASLTLWVKRLLIANVATFVALLIVGLATDFPFESYLAFRPVSVLTRPWTPLTYMFVHAGFFHLLFNMLGLFFFGPVLEDRWGSREFLKFYLICGLAGALLSVAFPTQAIVGASAAVFGVMVAFAMYWPDSPIYIWGIFPIKAKWLVGALVGINLYSAMSGAQSGTAYLAHLGGAFAAFAYLKSPLAPSAFGEVYSSPRRKKRGWREMLPFSRRKAQRQKMTVVAARPAPVVPRDTDDVDRILDKISSQGIGALTAEERKQLEDASRRLGTN